MIPHPTSLLSMLFRVFRTPGAPAMFFLSGLIIGAKVSASDRITSKLRTLLFRGALFVFLDLAIINTIWHFHFWLHGSFFLGTSALLVFGLSFLVIPFFLKLPTAALAALSAGIFLGQEFFPVSIAEGNLSFHRFLAGLLWKVIPIHYGNLLIELRFPFLAWFAIMLLGVCHGRFYSSVFSRWKARSYLAYGLLLFSLFLGIRLLLPGFGNMGLVPPPVPFGSLALSKYPPSILFTVFGLAGCMVYLALCKHLESQPFPRLQNFLSVTGRNPFFVFFIHPFILVPPLVIFDLKSKFGSLALVAAAFSVTVLAVYPLTVWYDKFRKRHKSQWEVLRYM